MSTPRIFAPFRIRDFALLWTGLSVSLLGDGIYLVAIAWQVYELSDAPTALSIVGLAWTVPLVAFVLVGGVVSDRFERRSVMIASDLVRGAAILALGLLSVTGALELWHVIALVAVYGAGEAFFGPAHAAIVPELVPRRLLVEANSLAQFVNPLCLRLAGPALGGVAVATLGAGGGFLLDAATFVASAAALSLIRRRPPPQEGSVSLRSAVRDVAEGFRFARSQPWLWGTLLAASVSMLVWWGPVEVLLPYVVKNTLGGGAASLGFVFAAGGAGAILTALVMAERGLPRMHMRFLYVTWALATAVVAVYGVASELWLLGAASFVSGGAGAAGLIVWATMTQRLVPARLLGRVESVDWLVSVGLAPVSFALTGPIAGLVGVQATLIGAGVLGGAAVWAFLYFPGVRDTERDPERLAALGIRNGNPSHKARSARISRRERGWDSGRARRWKRRLGARSSARRGVRERARAACDEGADPVVQLGQGPGRDPGGGR